MKHKSAKSTRGVEKVKQLWRRVGERREGGKEERGRGRHGEKTKKTYQIDGRR